MSRKPSSCAVFCRVVDNFGDAGVALRLSRQLAREHAIATTLFVDDLASLARIAPGLDPQLAVQQHADVTVRRFDAHQAGADLVVETFGCGVPDAYLDAMERSAPAGIWVNLEHLSAEAWVEGTHGLASPPPRRALERWFLFPGFTPRTGGLLRERDLFARRDAHAASIASQAAVWNVAGFRELPANALTVSLFCYPNAAAPALLRRWSQGAEPVVCIVPESVAREAIEAVAGRVPQPGFTVRAGSLTLGIAPFVDQDAFDARLWSCAFDFVRGEDSFVRAQWAARPFAWHTYPQPDDAHLAKLRAFLDRYVERLSPRAASAMRAFWEAWNAQQGEGAAMAWQPMREQLPTLARHARAWCDELAAQTDLATALVEFASERL